LAAAPLVSQLAAAKCDPAGQNRFQPAEFLKAVDDPIVDDPIVDSPTQSCDEFRQRLSLL
jgi:hypothetical protein